MSKVRFVPAQQPAANTLGRPFMENYPCRGTVILSNPPDGFQASREGAQKPLVFFS